MKKIYVWLLLDTYTSIYIVIGVLTRPHNFNEAFPFLAGTIVGTTLYLIILSIAERGQSK
jgi:arginine exporter protein ArgO